MKLSILKKQQLLFLQSFIKRTDPELGNVVPEAAPLRRVAQKLHNRLRTPVRFILAGEFSAGKSTLANLLAGKNLAPTSILAGDLPPLLFRYGAKEQIAAGWWGQKKLMPVEGLDFKAAVRLKPDFILVNTTNPFFKEVNIFDCPGTSDPCRDDTRMQHLIKSAEATIWCTNAVQAWRESERYAWNNLPAINRKNSILAVTHVDLPVVRPNLGRVMARVHKEAGNDFRIILPIAVTKAAKAASGGAVQDRKAWVEHGGQALLDAIAVIAKPILEKKLLDVSKIINQQFVPFAKHFDLGKGAVTRRGMPDGQQENPLLDVWNHKIEGLISNAEHTASADNGNLIRSSCDIVTEMTDALDGVQPRTQEIAWVADQFRDARDQLVLMQLETGDEPLETTAGLLLQLSRDLAQVAAHA